MFNIFTAVSLLSFLICIFLSILVYFKIIRYSIDNKIGKMFILLCISLAFCWALIEFGYRLADSYEIATLWLNINVTWYFVVAFLLHFTLCLTENKKILKRKLTYILIYFPALLFFLIDISTDLLKTEPLFREWGWTYGIPNYPLIYSISSTWAAFTGLFCIYICIDYLILLKNKREKNKIKYIIIGLLFPVTISLHTEWLFPLMDVQVPELIVPALTIGLVIIWYSSIRKKSIKINDKYQTIKNDVDNIIFSNS